MSVSEEVRRALKAQQRRLQRESELADLRKEIEELKKSVLPPAPTSEPTPEPQPEPLLIDTTPEPVAEPLSLLDRLRKPGRDKKAARLDKRKPQPPKEEKAAVSDP